MAPPYFHQCDSCVANVDIRSDRFDRFARKRPNSRKHAGPWPPVFGRLPRGGYPGAGIATFGPSAYSGAVSPWSWRPRRVISHASRTCPQICPRALPSAQGGMLRAGALLDTAMARDRWAGRLQSRVLVRLQPPGSRTGVVSSLREEDWRWGVRSLARPG